MRRTRSCRHLTSRGIVRYARLHGPWGFYVPPGEFHATYQRGNLPLVILWVTGKVGTDGDAA